MEKLNVRLLGDNIEFEKKINELQEITKALENPDIKMDEGVELYQKGVEIAKECYTMLNEVKGKVNIIKKDLLLLKTLV